MTDEQIIKNLKEITDNKIIRNNTCIISLSFLGEILDFSNRQTAEIESLKQIIYEDSKEIIELHRRIVFWQENLRSSKSETIKEFAERLKTKLDNLEFRTKTHRKTVPTKFCDDNVNWVLHECVPRDIDNLVKEMTEEKE